MAETTDSGANTVLIVLVLVLVVGFLVWFFSGNMPGTAAPVEQPGFNVDVNLPTNSGGQTGGGEAPQQ